MGGIWWVEDMTTFLPAAARSSLIAAERQPGFSEEAFDRYCLQACQARKAAVDETAFAREVCAVAPAAAGTSATASQDVTVAAFVLRGTVRIGEAGAPLAEITQALGSPEQDAVTPYECGSAFEEGEIRQLRYSGLVLETDGTKAVVRSMALIAGNRLALSDGELIQQVDEAEFKRRFGDRAERVGDVYRIGAGAGSDWETAYDFYFENGRLARVDYWIGC